MALAAHLRALFKRDAASSGRFRVYLFVRPDNARELAERASAAHLRGKERDVVRAQRLELAARRLEPARLHSDARAAERARVVFALDAVD